MVRRYRDDPVPDEVLVRVLDAARRAPSAGFTQPHRFVVATGADRRRAIADACGEPEAVARGLSPWLSVAPVHVVPCVEIDAYHRRYAEPDKARSGGPGEWDVPFWWVDGGAGMMLLLLAAVDEGLGAGFLAVDAEAIRAAADVPDAWTPLGLVTLGYAAEDQPGGSGGRRVRLPLDEIVRLVG